MRPFSHVPHDSRDRWRQSRHYVIAAFVLSALTLAAVPVAAVLPSCGDATGDGAITAVDALLTLRRAVNWQVKCNECACDVTADGSVTATDSLAVLRRAVGSLPYLSCIASVGCEEPSPALIDPLTGEEPAGVLLLVSGSALDPSVPTWVVFFGGAVRAVVPAIRVEHGGVAAAIPPIQPHTTVPALGYRVQALQGESPSVTATNVLSGLIFAPIAAAPSAPGTITADFLAHAILRAQTLTGLAPPAGDLAAALNDVRLALISLQTGIVQLRYHTIDTFPLGTLDGNPLVLTRADLSQSDALILAALYAQTLVSDASVAGPSVTGSMQAGPRIPPAPCRSAQAAAYRQSLLEQSSTATTGPAYAASICDPVMFDEGYAWNLGAAAMAVGLIENAPSAAMPLEPPAAAAAYAALRTDASLMVMGSLLTDPGEDAVDMVHAGKTRAEITEPLAAAHVRERTGGDIDVLLDALAELSSRLDEFDPAHPPTGACCSTEGGCCEPEGSCLIVPSATCLAIGYYRGDDSVCEDYCPRIACCFGGSCCDPGWCLENWERQSCEYWDGIPQEPGVTCDEACP